MELQDEDWTNKHDLAVEGWGSDAKGRSPGTELDRVCRDKGVSPWDPNQFQIPSCDEKALEFVEEYTLSSQDITVSGSYEGDLAGPAKSAKSSALPANSVHHQHHRGAETQDPGSFVGQQGNTLPNHNQEGSLRRKRPAPLPPICKKNSIDGDVTLASSDKVISEEFPFRNTVSVRRKRNAPKPPGASLSSSQSSIVSVEACPTTYQVPSLPDKDAREPSVQCRYIIKEEPGTLVSDESPIDGQEITTNIGPSFFVPLPPPYSPPVTGYERSELQPIHMESPTCNIKEACAPGMDGIFFGTVSPCNDICEESLTNSDQCLTEVSKEMDDFTIIRELEDGAFKPSQLAAEYNVDGNTEETELSGRASQDVAVDVSELVLQEETPLSDEVITCCSPLQSSFEQLNIAGETTSSVCKKQFSSPDSWTKKKLDSKYDFRRKGIQQESKNDQLIYDEGVVKFNATQSGVNLDDENNGGHVLQLMISTEPVSPEENVSEKQIRSAPLQKQFTSVLEVCPPTVSDTKLGAESTEYHETIQDAKHDPENAENHDIIQDAKQDPENAENRDIILDAKQGTEDTENRKIVQDAKQGTEGTENREIMQDAKQDTESTENRKIIQDAKQGTGGTETRKIIQNTKQGIGGTETRKITQDAKQGTGGTETRKIIQGAKDDAGKIETRKIVHENSNITYLKHLTATSSWNSSTTSSELISDVTSTHDGLTLMLLKNQLTSVTQNISVIENVPDNETKSKLLNPLLLQREILLQMIEKESGEEDFASNTLFEKPADDDNIVKTGRETGIGHDLLPVSGEKVQTVGKNAPGSILHDHHRKESVENGNQRRVIASAEVGCRNGILNVKQQTLSHEQSMDETTSNIRFSKDTVASRNITEKSMCPAKEICVEDNKGLIDSTCSDNFLIENNKSLLSTFDENITEKCDIELGHSQDKFSTNIKRPLSDIYSKIQEIANSKMAYKNSYRCNFKGKEVKPDGYIGGSATKENPLKCQQITEYARKPFNFMEGGESSGEPYAQETEPNSLRKFPVSRSRISSMNKSHNKDQIYEFEHGKGKVGSCHSCDDDQSIIVPVVDRFLENNNNISIENRNQLREGVTNEPNNAHTLELITEVQAPIVASTMPLLDKPIVPSGERPTPLVSNKPSVLKLKRYSSRREEIESCFVPSFVINRQIPNKQTNQATEALPPSEVNTDISSSALEVPPHVKSEHEYEPQYSSAYDIHSNITYDRQTVLLKKLKCEKEIICGRANKWSSFSKFRRFYNLKKKTSWEVNY
eukprot:gene3839-4374_t